MANRSWQAAWRDPNPSQWTYGALALSAQAAYGSVDPFTLAQIDRRWRDLGKRAAAGRL